MKINLLPIVVLVAAAAVAASAAVARDARSAEPSKRLTEIAVPGAKLSLRYPANWYVTTRRLDYVVDPHTLVAVAAYVIPTDAGAKCDGTQGRGRPADGAFVLIKELLDGASLKRSLPRPRPRPTHFRVPTAGRAGCLPANSAVYQFRIAQRAFYVYVSVGPRATAATRRAVARVLDTMRIATNR